VKISYLKFIKSINFITLLSVFTIIVLYFKLFQVHLHYPTNDEIITFQRYLNWKGLFWKDAPNNHLLLSFVGNISNEIFGFNFKLLRFYNFLFFFILNKSPFTRVYVGLIYFFIFHICLNFEKFFFIIKYKEKLFLKILFSIILFILLLFAKPNNDYQELKDVILKIGKYNNCTLLNDHLNVKEKWVLMNFYPGRCQYFHDRENNIKLLY